MTISKHRNTGWRSIRTAPKTEDMPFLVLTPGNDVADFVILQVTRFEGVLYPDHLDGSLDFRDAVENATHWMPAPKLPRRARASIERGEART